MIDKTTEKPTPVWTPSPAFMATTNIAETLKELNLTDYSALHRLSVKEPAKFWEYVLQKLNIRMRQPYQQVLDLSNGIESPQWLPGAQMNIIESCFNAPKDAIALIHQTETGELKKVTYAELEKIVNRIANSLAQHQIKFGDKAAIIMPMNLEAVAIYLALIKAGCAAVSIADSFAPTEIATRLKIADAHVVFTQDFSVRDQKKLPMYEKVVASGADKIIVLPVGEQLALELRPQDLSWQDFLGQNSSDKHTEFSAVAVAPHHHSNILFSSGTTGEPKAIPWTHTTPIKAGMDAHFHQDIHPGDVVAWPTNLGWMMGPWLIYASLLNQGTIALYDGVPTQAGFGKFIQDAKVNMLGLVPSIVKAWRASRCMEDFDWSAIKLFSSTGECSNPDDMLYLMSLAENKPVIEYCGGTEIGGAYVTSTLVQPSVPSWFTTPVLGLDFVLLDEQGQPSDQGEVALIPPSIGLSTELINREHYEVYYADMPKLPDGTVLRRHGDQLEKVDGYYRALGRVDDTMNLGAIKVSSVEIERVLDKLAEIKETAAIAVSPPHGGPSELVIYAVLNNSQQIPENLQQQMQALIRTELNPLFKIADVVCIEALPRTASNKVMRRVLRDEYRKA